jgi:hypothetical protein
MKMRFRLLVFLTLFVCVAFSGTAAMAGLIAHWKLDGNAADSVGNHDGTIEGDPVWEANGRIDGAIVLDGDGDYIQTTLMDELHTANNFTLAVWFWTNVTDTGQQHILWMGDVAGNGWGNQQELHLSINHFNYSNIVNAYFGSGEELDGTAINIVSKEEFTDTSGWHHLALSIKNANGPTVTGRLYLDGEWAEPLVDGFVNGNGDLFPTIDSTDKPPDRTQWNTALRIGSPGPASRFFNGMLDDVTIWDKALDQDDIQDLIKGGVGVAVQPGGKLATTWGALK